jgi:signal transduction histidine kinase
MTTDRAEKDAAGFTRERRRKYLISPAFQWRYTGMVVVGVFLASVLMSIVQFGILFQQARARVLTPATPYAGQSTLVMALSAVAFAAVIALAFGFWSIRYTHRLGGPLFVMKGHLQELAEGRYPQRRPLRKKDEFKDLHDALWQAIDTLRARGQSELEAVSKALDTARAAGDADDYERRDALDRVATQLESLRRDMANVMGQELDRPAVAPKINATAVSKTRAYTELPA